MNEIDADKVLVDLYADVQNSKNAECVPMHLQSLNKDERIYTAHVIKSRAAGEYTVRIMANYENIVAPLENNLILWQR